MRHCCVIIIQNDQLQIYTIKHWVWWGIASDTILFMYTITEKNWIRRVPNFILHPKWHTLCTLDCDITDIYYKNLIKPHSCLQMENVLFYCMSKAAIDQFTRCLSTGMQSCLDIIFVYYTIDTSLMFVLNLITTMETLEVLYCKELFPNDLVWFCKECLHIISLSTSLCEWKLIWL